MTVSSSFINSGLILEMHPASIFWFVAGVLVAIALLVVLYPWLSGQQRARLWPALPRWVAPGGVVLIILAVAIYLKLGSPQLLAGDAIVAGPAGAAMPGAAMPAAAAATAATTQAAASMDSAVTGLERRLAAGGGSDADWDLLAKSYEFMNRPEDAAAARRKQLPAGAGQGGAAAAVAAPVAAAPAKALSPEAVKLKAAADEARRQRNFAAAKVAYLKLVGRKEMSADTWADYADVLASLNGNKLAGEPEALVKNALALDPNHPKALWLEASLEHESGRYAAAVGTWQHLAAVMGPQSGDAPLIASNIAEDQRLAGGGAAAAPGPAVAAPAAINASFVQGDVVLADSLAGKVPAGLTLFIVAKSVQAPGPPVAILRLSTGTWPVHFRLDDSQAMVPGRNLSSAGPVTIEARTSRTGQAAPQPGDFQGVIGPLTPAGAKPVKLVIGKVIG
jgi:cytochrome c-type biogenesis protein CcmH